nr:pitrilysin family protein [Luteolibacter marinus]
MSCFASKAPAALDLMIGALKEPRYEREVIARELKNREADIAWEKDDPGSLARDAFVQAVLGEHPYGRAMRRGKPEDLAGIGRDELASALAALRRPEDAVLFIVGPKDDRLLEQAREKFGAWSAAPDPTPPIKDPVYRKPLSFEKVERPEMDQIRLQFGAMGPAAGVPDRAAHLVFAQMMTSGFTSVLTDELRVKRGLVYGISFHQVWLDHPSPFSLSTSTRAEKAEEVLQVCFDKLREVRAGKVEDERLTAARNTLQVGIAEATDTGFGLAEAEYLGYRRNGDFDAWRKLHEEIREVSAESVVAAAQHYDPAGFKVILVGEKAKLEAFDPAQLEESLRR